MKMFYSYTVASMYLYHLHIALVPPFFFLLTANLGLVLVIYLYSIHRAICRPSDHSVVRPRAEIRTRDGRI